MNASCHVTERIRSPMAVITCRLITFRTVKSQSALFARFGQNSSVYSVKPRVPIAMAMAMITLTTVSFGESPRPRDTPLSNGARLV